ncbi:hypothetical protein LCGC14_2294130 [marine sediment metagenome]|uniref:Uncharacterized protein n=1 Tax=marine sediment metagenome TaxID=412755 RepID=A0A0F9CQC3_9ZZZZ
MTGAMDICNHGPETYCTECAHGWELLPETPPSYCVFCGMELVSEDGISYPIIGGRCHKRLKG